MKCRKLSQIFRDKEVVIDDESYWPKYRISLSELEELFVFFLVNSSAEITNLKELDGAHLTFAHYRCQKFDKNTIFFIAFFSFFWSNIRFQDNELSCI